MLTWCWPSNSTLSADFRNSLLPTPLGIGGLLKVEPGAANMDVNDGDRLLRPTVWGPVVTAAACTSWVVGSGSAALGDSLVGRYLLNAVYGTRPAYPAKRRGRAAGGAAGSTASTSVCVSRWTAAPVQRRKRGLLVNTEIGATVTLPVARPLDSPGGLGDVARLTTKPKVGRSPKRSRGTTAGWGSTSSVVFVSKSSLDSGPSLWSTLSRSPWLE